MAIQLQSSVAGVLALLIVGAAVMVAVIAPGRFASSELAWFFLPFLEAGIAAVGVYRLRPQTRTGRICATLLFAHGVAIFTFVSVGWVFARLAVAFAIVRYLPVIALAILLAALALTALAWRRDEDGFFVVIIGAATAPVVLMALPRLLR